MDLMDKLASLGAALRRTEYFDGTARCACRYFTTPTLWTRTVRTRRGGAQI